MCFRLQYRAAVIDRLLLPPELESVATNTRTATE